MRKFGQRYPIFLAFAGLSPLLLPSIARRWLVLGILGGAWGAAIGSFHRTESALTLRTESTKVSFTEDSRVEIVKDPQPQFSAQVELQREVVIERVKLPAAEVPALVEGDGSGDPIGEPTPLESEQIGRLLGLAHRQLYGVYPGPERWAIAWAHVSHEISRGKTCIENNFGNIVISRRWRGKWHLRRVKEMDRRREPRWVVQQVRFRTYETPLEGAMDYWRVITGHFGSALPFFDTGDAAKAGETLCERGYSTNDCGGYGAGIRGLYLEIRARYGQLSKSFFSSWELQENTIIDSQKNNLSVSLNQCERRELFS